MNDQEGRELAKRALDDMKNRLDRASTWRVESQLSAKENDPKKIGFVRSQSTSVHRLVVEVEE